MLPRDRDFDQLVVGNDVSIKKIYSYNYKIVIKEIKNFLVYQTWSEINSNNTNNDRIVKYESAKEWINYFTEFNKYNENNKKPLFCPTTVMRIKNNSYIFAINKAYFKNNHVVFKVSTKQINLEHKNNKKLIKLPCGHHNGVRFDIDALPLYEKVYIEAFDLIPSTIPAEQLNSLKAWDWSQFNLQTQIDICNKYKNSVQNNVLYVSASNSILGYVLNNNSTGPAYIHQYLVTPSKIYSKEDGKLVEISSVPTPLLDENGKIITINDSVPYINGNGGFSNGKPNIPTNFYPVVNYNCLTTSISQHDYIYAFDMDDDAVPTENVNGKKAWKWKQLDWKTQDYVCTYNTDGYVGVSSQTKKNNGDPTHPDEFYQVYQANWGIGGKCWTCRIC